METVPTEPMEPTESTEYHSAYQTWTLVTKLPCTPTVSKAQTACFHAAGGAQSKRAEFQIARIKKRLSISALAAQIHVDPDTLSAFERGMDVLEPAVIKRMESLLLA